MKVKFQTLRRIVKWAWQWRGEVIVEKRINVEEESDSEEKECNQLNITQLHFKTLLIDTFIPNKQNSYQSLEPCTSSWEAPLNSESFKFA